MIAKICATSTFRAFVVLFLYLSRTQFLRFAKYLRAPFDLAPLKNFIAGMRPLKISQNLFEISSAGLSVALKLRSDLCGG